jgi:AcrR family transcriptional regulator
MRSAWSDLDAGSKHDRLLEAAERVFAEQGLEAPMPVIAQAAGAGIGSVYRQIASKEELVAALAERRLAEIEAELDRALGDEDAWRGFSGFLWRALEARPYDDVSSAAIASAQATPSVGEVRGRVHRKVEELVARAQAQGTMRADASRQDVTLVFLSARAVKHVGPDAWRRVVELALDGLRV